MYCSKCGTENPEGVGYCRNCGEALRSSQNTTSATVAAESLEKSNSKRGLIIGVIAAALVAIFLVFNIHTCDQCHSAFFGQSYYDMLRGTDYTLCQNCASQYYGDPYYQGYKK